MTAVIASIYEAANCKFTDNIVRCVSSMAAQVETAGEGSPRYEKVVVNNLESRLSKTTQELDELRH